MEIGAVCYSGSGKRAAPADGSFGDPTIKYVEQSAIALRSWLLYTFCSDSFGEC